MKHRSEHSVIWTQTPVDVSAGRQLYDAWAAGTGRATTAAVAARASRRRMRGSVRGGLRTGATSSAAPPPPAAVRDGARRGRTRRASNADALVRGAVPNAAPAVRA